MTPPAGAGRPAWGRHRVDAGAEHPHTASANLRRAGIETRPGTGDYNSRFPYSTCLVNSYEPGARLSPHRDRDERDFGSSIAKRSIPEGAFITHEAATGDTDRARG